MHLVDVSTIRYVVVGLNQVAQSEYGTHADNPLEYINIITTTNYEIAA